MIFKTKKADQDNLTKCLEGILNDQDIEVLVVREKGCNILFANKKAKARIDTFHDDINDTNDANECKSTFAADFPELCKSCPYGGRVKTATGKAIIKSNVIKDKNSRSYKINFNETNWIDGKPATVIFINEITKEKNDIDHLYKLAYIDSLTGVPNRQRLKDDFAAIEAKLEKNEISGAFALFDIDNFKAVNDTYGHSTGDVILRRLAEHLSFDKAFKNHLYRLGGDEFVLFYTNPMGEFASEEELKEHYKKILSGALQSYSLHNINLTCTLSMGVSFFPMHGTKFSDIVRKADIAMYKAKTNGRNRIVLFEDQYLVAKKFKDLFINIQPILISSGKTYGYELIDGDNTGSEKNDYNTVCLSELNRAMDALHLGDINNKTYYFISYTRQLLNPAVLGNLPKGKFIVMLPYVSNLSRDELQIYIDLKNKGYSLALSGVKDVAAAKPLLKIASYYKLNIKDRNPIIQKDIMDANPSIRLIATGVNTLAEFEAAKNAGFHLFRGYYFNQPVIVKKTKDMDPLKINYLRLLKLSGTEDYMDFREISSIISSDVALTYKLLRILNSAAVGLRNVSSMAMAVAYLGEESLKKWIAVLALRGMVDDKPLELVRMSLIRARFGELLAPHLRVKRNPEHVFMVGMLSLLHIALEKTKEQLLEEVPVSQDIRDSLLTKNGIHSELLKFFESFEYANWDEVSRFTSENQLDSQFVNDAYISAIKWYNELTDPV